MKHTQQPLAALAASTFYQEIGDVRVVCGEIQTSDDSVRPGLMVQQWEESESGREFWNDVCPLSDASFSLYFCPPNLRKVSVYLRDLMESGVALNLDMEIAAARGAA